VALVALIFLLPWLGAALLPYLRPLLGRHLGRWALIPPAASFLVTLTFVSSTSHDQEVLYTLPWFPALGVNFSLWIDGLSVFFALLIAGMGLLITWYSHYYLWRHRSEAGARGLLPPFPPAADGHQWLISDR
jgi:multicomponent Na+:H+ antiporter subunit A